MRWIVTLAIFIVITGCFKAQPESAKTVAAFEVPLPSEADRRQFLLVLRAAAEAEGMHVDNDSSNELRQLAELNPALAMTVHAAVWRSSNHDVAVASAMDQQDHLGNVWLLFSRGEDPALTSRFQQRVMREIMVQWPSTLSLPIMPTGVVPLYRDLIRTTNGYLVNPAEAQKYRLKRVENRRR
jgi:hypothetical protein